MAFLGVVLGLLAQPILVWVVVRAPEHDPLRRLVVRLWRWAHRYKVRLGMTSGLSVLGLVEFGEVAWEYEDMHLASRTLVAALIVVDVILISWMVVRAVWKSRTETHARRPLGAAVGAVLMVASALAFVRGAANCDVLHPFDEPAMSVQRGDPGQFVKVAPNAPFRRPVPPPLAAKPGAVPSLGPLRAERLPPLTPGRQPEPTEEPFGGCILQRHPH